MMDKKRDETSDSDNSDNKEESRTPGSRPGESDPRKRPEPGTGGISTEKYREATEEAVEDIHG
jgi:hypothetical protein